MSTPGSILVVEDDTAYRRICSLALRSAGFEVATATTAAEAQRLLREHRVDLVLTDLCLSDASGLEGVARLRQTFPETRVVVMSGGGTTAAEETLRAVPNLGAAGALCKPFTLEELVRTVRSALTGSASATNPTFP